MSETGDDRLDGLDRTERFAALTLEAATGGTAEPWDVNGRQAAHDFNLNLADRRLAAVEVTIHARPGVMQRNSILGSQDYKWPNPGSWAWSATVDDPRDIPLLRERSVDIVMVCEGLGVPHPGELPYRLLPAYPALQWLVEESSARMCGMPDVPARDGGRPVPVGNPASLTVTTSDGAPEVAGTVLAELMDRYHFIAQDESQSQQSRGMAADLFMRLHELR